MTIDWRVFLLVVFSASGGVYGAMHLLGGIAGPHFAQLASALMWIPGIAASAAFALNGELRRTPGWKPAGWPYWIVAILVPPLIYAGAAGALVASGAAAFPETLASVRDGTVHLAGARRLVLGAAPQSLSYFLLNAALTAACASPMIAAMTLGEELGWRAFLQPRLAHSFGLRSGLVMTGLIWGFWHFPLILMGYNFPGYPLSGAFILMPLMSLGMAVFIGWLYLKTRCIWAPVLAHASNNAAGGLLLNLQRPAGSRLPIYLVSVAAWLAVGFACFLALENDRRP